MLPSSIPIEDCTFFSTGGGSGALSVFREDSPDKYTPAA
jgi:hypothetical protein